jgi:uncharacterized SAM-binding protein YcdF (DUF218 family)
MEFWLSKFAGAVLLPPASPLLLALLGLVVARRWRRGGLALTAFGLLMLWVLSTPVIGNLLLTSIEPRDAASADALGKAQAIVVLGGGTYFSSPEYAGDTVNASSLERVRWAAHLQRETGLPVMVAGGFPMGSSVSEAEQMRDALERDFRVPVKWVEARSDNTLESAAFAREILSPAGVSRIALVTHASHMRRARRAFAQEGFMVLEAPTAFSTAGPLTVMSFLPAASALVQTRTFCHEALGLGWYHVRRLATARD